MKFGNDNLFAKVMLKKNICKFIFLSVAISTEIFAAPISAESMQLGYCEFVYFYSAQNAQMQNNEGLAKAYLRRSSMLTAANFLLLEEGGKISGEKIKKVRESALAAKPKFDTNPAYALAELKQCDNKSLDIASDVRRLGKKLWGKDYDQLQQEMFATNMQQLGIR